MPVKNATSDSDTITVRDAAPLIGKTARGMYRAIAAGHVERGVFFRIGRDIYVSRERLLEWKKSGGTAASPEARGAA